MTISELTAPSLPELAYGWPPRAYCLAKVPAGGVQADFHWPRMQNFHAIPSLKAPVHDVLVYVN